MISQLLSWMTFLIGGTAGVPPEKNEANLPVGGLQPNHAAVVGLNIGEFSLPKPRGVQQKSQHIDGQMLPHGPLNVRDELGDIRRPILPAESKWTASASCQESLLPQSLFGKSQARAASVHGLAENFLDTATLDELDKFVNLAWRVGNPGISGQSIP